MDTKSQNRISSQHLKSVFDGICALGPRWQGSEGEKKILDFLENSLEKGLGVEFSKEKFSYLSFLPEKAILQTLDSPSKEIACQALAYSPSMEVSGELVFVAEDDIPSTDFSGKIVLTDAVRSYLAYPLVSKGNALGLILGNRLPGNLLRVGVTNYGGKLGNIPALAVGAEDTQILRVLADRGGSVRIGVFAGTSEENGYNLIVRQNGNGEKGAILICSHYDSMWLGPHANDNASGTAAVLELIRFFKDTPYHLIFLLCGAEELGFWGSRSFARNHGGACRDLLAVLCTDALSSRLGPVEIGVTERLAPTIRELSRKHGLSVDRWSTPPRPGSDHASFESFGKPTVWLTTNAPYYHTAADLPEHVDIDNLQKHTEFLTKVIMSLAT